MKKRRTTSGQVMTEFAAMLVLAAILALAVISLAYAVTAKGERMTRVVRFSVP